MKALILTDVHETTNWKRIVAKYKDEVDKIVFNGDYFDTHGPSECEGVLAANNLEEIIEFKKSQPEGKVVLHIGNHDFHYLPYISLCNPGQVNMKKCFMDVLIRNREHFTIATALEVKDFKKGERIQWGDEIPYISHAGFSRTWYATTLLTEAQAEDSIIPSLRNEEVKEPYIFANKLFSVLMEYMAYHAQKIYEGKPEPLNSVTKRIASYFDYPIAGNDWSGTGDTRYAGPLWIRPASLLTDAWYHRQIVGHSVHAGKDPLFLWEASNDDTGPRQLIMLDNEDHDGFMIYDTNVEYKFETIADANRRVKKEQKEIDAKKSREGQYKKDLRDKYQISKSDLKYVHDIVFSEYKNLGIEPTEEKFWAVMDKAVEAFCNGEDLKEVIS